MSAPNQDIEAVVGFVGFEGEASGVPTIGGDVEARHGLGKMTGPGKAETGRFFNDELAGDGVHGRYGRHEKKGLTWAGVFP